MKKITLSKNEIKKLEKIRRKHQDAYEEETKKLLHKMWLTRLLGLKK